MLDTIIFRGFKLGHVLTVYKCVRISSNKEYNGYKECLSDKRVNIPKVRKYIGLPSARYMSGFHCFLDRGDADKYFGYIKRHEYRIDSS